MKISIIGAGNVGGMTAMRVAQEALGDVVLIDVAVGLAKGKALDIEDSFPLGGGLGSISGSEDIAAVEGSDIIVVTAGLARKPGMTREDLLAKNAAIIGGICQTIKTRASNAIVIVVTNPLDVMTWYCVKKLGFASGRIIGMGATLDSARFAAIIAKELRVPVSKIDACVIASHGEAMLPLARFTFVNGRSLIETLPDPEVRNALSRRTAERGKEIVSLLGSGSAYSAPSAAICQIVRAICKDQKARLAASAYLTGEYGVQDVCVGVPCIIGRTGVEQIIELELNNEERQAFQASAQSVRQMCALLAG